jgi:hypothetical protein
VVGEFLVGFDRGQPIFGEVKSPGWEDEIAKAEGQDSPRFQQPKYIDLEGGATAPWAAVRYAVTKAYPKMPDNVAHEARHQRRPEGGTSRLG